MWSVHCWGHCWGPSEGVWAPDSPGPVADMTDFCSASRAIGWQAGQQAGPKSDFVRGDQEAEQAHLGWWQTCQTAALPAGA